MRIGVTVVDANGENPRCCQMEYPTSGPPYHLPRGHPFQLELTLPNSQIYRSEGDDFFGCLRILRLYLEKHGLRVLVQGARRHVWSTRMQRDMGAGLQGFVMNNEGRPVERRDEVSIFDPAELRDIASVAEQQAFAMEWFKKWVVKPRTPEELSKFTEAWSWMPTLPD